MGTSIRTYHKKDKAHCLAAFKSNVPKYFTEAEIEEFEQFLDNYDTKKNDDKNEQRTRFFVIELNNRITGCGGFGDKRNNHIISLAWGLIHKDFHKMGLGKELLLYRLEQIKKIHPGAPIVVDTTQHSFSFFEKFGFFTTKITENFYTAGMHRYDMIFKND